MARRDVREHPQRGRRERAERITGLHPVREALRAGRRELHRLTLGSAADRPERAELVALAEAARVAVREHSEGPEPGPVLEAGPLPELELEELAAREEAGGEPRVLVALDGVEDPQNLGAIARVAEGAGVTGLVLTRRRAPPLSPAVSRASAGAIEWLPVARVTNLARALDLLRREGFWTLGADAEASESIYDLPERLARADRVVVLGAEGKGLRTGVRSRLDTMRRIPLGGRVESLNVSTAAAILLFELRRRCGVAG